MNAYQHLRTPLERFWRALLGEKAATSLGVKINAPFMALSFLALPVIHHLKLTDKGLVDVDKFAIVPLGVDS